MYPKVYEDYRKILEKYGDLSVLPTRYFLKPLEVNEEIVVEIEQGKTLIIKLLAVGEISKKTGTREVFFELNGEMRSVTIDDKNVSIENKTRPKATCNQMMLLHQWPVLSLRSESRRIKK